MTVFLERFSRSTLIIFSFDECDKSIAIDAQRTWGMKFDILVYCFGYLHFKAFSHNIVGNSAEVMFTRLHQLVQATNSAVNPNQGIETSRENYGPN